MLLLWLSCVQEDPCAVNDLERCVDTEGCIVFTTLQMEKAATTGWCYPSGGAYEGLECVTDGDVECDPGTHYAAPPDADGNPTDTCFAYTGCDKPLGWVDCDPQPEISIGECD